MSAAAIPAFEQERLSALARYSDMQDSAAAETFRRYAKLAEFVLDVPHGAVSLVARDRQHITGTDGRPSRSTPRDVAFCAHAILQDTPLVVEDALLDARFSSNPTVVGEPGIRFYAGAPLASRERLNIGTLCGYDTRPRTVTPRQTAALVELANGLMTTLELMRSSSRMQAMALTDALTGLANRMSLATALEDEVSSCNRAGTPFSLAYLDCDHFKALNDSAGHAVGDDMLRVLAAELREHVRSSDMPARLAGDEFAVLMPDTDAAEAQGAMARFMKHFRGIVCSAGWKTSLSIGVATFRDGGIAAREVMALADAAMYEAKRLGRDMLAATVRSGSGQPTAFTRSR